MVHLKLHLRNFIITNKQQTYLKRDMTVLHSRYSPDSDLEQSFLCVYQHFLQLNVVILPTASNNCQSCATKSTVQHFGHTPEKKKTT